MKMGRGEVVIKNKAANLFKGIEAVGGRVLITNQRIIFQPHPLNIQRGVVEIPLDDITEVRERNTLGIFPNGILIKTTSGREYKFVVWNRKSLMELIRSEVAGPQ